MARGRKWRLDSPARARGQPQVGPLQGQRRPCSVRSRDREPDAGQVLETLKARTASMALLHLVLTVVTVRAKASPDPRHGRHTAAHLVGVLVPQKMAIPGRRVALLIPKEGRYVADRPGERTAPLGGRGRRS